jgi:hypothetical protein
VLVSAPSRASHIAQAMLVAQAREEREIWTRQTSERPFAARREGAVVPLGQGARRTTPRASRSAMRRDERTRL